VLEERIVVRTMAAHAMRLNNETAMKRHQQKPLPKMEITQNKSRKSGKFFEPEK
jgi:hypothetical protein